MLAAFGYSRRRPRVAIRNGTYMELKPQALLALPTGRTPIRETPMAAAPAGRGRLFAGAAAAGFRRTVPWPHARRDSLRGLMPVPCRSAEEPRSLVARLREPDLPACR